MSIDIYAIRSGIPTLVPHNSHRTFANVILVFPRRLQLSRQTPWWMAGVWYSKDPLLRENFECVKNGFKESEKRRYIFIWRFKGTNYCIPDRMAYISMLTYARNMMYATNMAKGYLCRTSRALGRGPSMKLGMKLGIPTMDWNTLSQILLRTSNS